MVAEFHRGTGNLQNWHPVPRVVPHTDEARRILTEARREGEAEYARAEASGDAVGTTVWGRLAEHARLDVKATVIRPHAEDRGRRNQVAAMGQESGLHRRDAGIDIQVAGHVLT